MPSSLYIKNMVCDRCKAAVSQILDNLKIDHLGIELGEVALHSQLTPAQQLALKDQLHHGGFELIEDASARIISRIKTLILDWTRQPQNGRPLKLSVKLSEALHRDYASLSNLFSSVEGITLEHYYILQKIERVKELLVYDELSLSEIAHSLNYSSVQHLSNQFKKITGLTPSHFKKIGAGKRMALDKI